jgi:FkbM family methyltransferase
MRLFRRLEPRKQKNREGHQIVFLDCGAHLGESVYKAREKWGDDIKIFCFEPHPELFQELKKLGVNAICKAVWDRNGKFRFYLDKAKPEIFEKRLLRSSLLKKKSGISTNNYIIVESINLSEWIKNNLTTSTYNILKLDVEGAEYSILEKIITDRTYHLIDELYGEWHQKKAKIPFRRHNKLLKNLESINLKMNEWQTKRIQPKNIDKKGTN